MKKIVLICSIIVAGLLLVSLRPSEPAGLQIAQDTPVWDVLQHFGEPAPNHRPDEAIAGASAEKGADLVLKGITKKPSGGKTSKQSAHFVCTSCHNIKKELPDLRQSDPQARLEYAQQQGIPFLQGTTLHGAVNRISFYNDDYEKKYGDLVAPTRNNLREAIQLCAIECSQGRRLKDWELESVLRYLWTLELTMEDLDMSPEAFSQLQQKVAAHQNGQKDQASIDLIKSYYQPGVPAHFVKPPEDRKVGYTGVEGNPENGKLVYDLSCKHCHENKRYSFFHLDDSKNTFRYLKKHFARYTRYSVYQVSRYGTSPMAGKRAYMPQYTEEKMSNQQMEDLRAYIEQEAR